MTTLLTNATEDKLFRLVRELIPSKVILLGANTREDKETLERVFDVKTETIQVSNSLDLLTNISRYIKIGDPLYIGISDIRDLNELVALLTLANLFEARTTLVKGDKTVSIPSISIKELSGKREDILRILADNGEVRSLEELASILDEDRGPNSVARLSYYVKKLEDSGLVEVRRGPRNKLNLSLTELGGVLVNSVRNFPFADAVLENP